MTQSIRSRTLVVLSSLLVCLTVGGLVSSCHDSATGKHSTGDGVGTLAAPIGEISGVWVISRFEQGKECEAR